MKVDRSGGGAQLTAITEQSLMLLTASFCEIAGRRMQI